MNEPATGFQTQSPPRCGRCQHTVRFGEPYEDRMWETNSGGPMPGVAHTPICPTDVPSVIVPCGPCLAHLLDRQVTAPHPCHGSTLLGVEAGQLVAAPEQACPCSCQARFRESDALRAARDAARTSPHE